MCLKDMNLRFQMLLAMVFTVSGICFISVSDKSSEDCPDNVYCSSPESNYESNSRNSYITSPDRNSGIAYEENVWQAVNFRKAGRSREL